MCSIWKTIDDKCEKRENERHLETKTRQITECKMTSLTIHVLQTMGSHKKPKMVVVKIFLFL